MRDQIVRKLKRTLHFVDSIRPSRAFSLMSLQAAGALSILLGIAQYSVPVALIVGGTGAILAVERQ